MSDRFQRIQYRQDTSIRWATVNPVLAVAEPGYETDTGRWKVGDGKTAWAGLPYKSESGLPGPSGPPGPVGPKGDRGDVGPAGPQGPIGAAGPATTLTIGSVSSGSNPAVTLTGTAPQQTLNFVIPQGPKGDTGAPGQAASLAIGNVAAGDDPSASISGTAPQQTLNLVLPRGIKGDKGEKGDTGAKGDQGIQGPKGDKGDQGSPGVQGEKGDKGDTGLQGLKGDKGDTGAAAVIKGTITTWPPAPSPSVGDLWIVSSPLPVGTPAGAAVGDGFVWSGSAWINVGPIRGPKGDTGERGLTGLTGAPGPANQLVIGSVSNGASASATITGTSPYQLLNLVLPKGDKGDQGIRGDQGIQGPTGPANNLQIGFVQSGLFANATVTGIAPNQLLNLVLPKGDKGEAGAKGDVGSVGPAGPANTLTVGTVTQGNPGTEPVVTITGNAPAQAISFVLPKPADPKEPVVPTITIGSVTQGSTANATITGTPPNFTLNLVLPSPKINQSTSFTQNPESKQAIAGESVVFTALAQSTETPIVYKWQTSTTGIAWNDIPGAGSTSYSVQATTALNNTFYRCIATTANVGPVPSAVASLSVAPAAVIVPDGKNWYIDQDVANMPSSAVAYNGLWVSNRATWQSQTASDWSTWQRSGTAPPTFSSVAASSAAVVGAVPVSVSGIWYLYTYSTSDGKNWQVRQNLSTTAFSYVANPQYFKPVVAFGAGRFVCLYMRQQGTNAPTLRVTTSTDGVTWTTPADIATTSFAAPRSMIFANGLFVAVGTTGAGSATSEFVTSPDGVNWTVRQMPSAQIWNDIAFNNNSFLVTSTGLVMAFGSTGTAFGQFNMPASADWSAVEGSGTHWVALAKLTTTTGLNVPGGSWTTGSIGAPAKWSWVGFGGGRFMALSEDGYGAMCDGSSNALIRFTLQPISQTLIENMTVTFSVDTINAPSNTLYQWQRSTDGGANWTNYLSPSTAKFLSFAAALNMNNSYFRCLAVVGTSTVATSAAALLVVLTDGASKPIAWTSNTPLSGDGLLPLDTTFSGSAGVAEHFRCNYEPCNGRIITLKGTTQDGRTFTPHIGFPDLVTIGVGENSFKAITSGTYFFNNRYVVARGRDVEYASPNGVITRNYYKSIVSTDGRNWTENGLSISDPGEVVAGSSLEYWHTIFQSGVGTSTTKNRTTDGLTATAITNTGQWWRKKSLGPITVEAYGVQIGVYVSGALRRTIGGSYIGFDYGFVGGFPTHVIFTNSGRWISQDAGTTWNYEENTVGYTGFCPVYFNGFWMMPARNASGVYYSSVDLANWFTHTNLPGQALGPAVILGGKLVIPCGTANTNLQVSPLTSLAVSP